MGVHCGSGAGGPGLGITGDGGRRMRTRSQVSHQGWGGRGHAQVNEIIHQHGVQGHDGFAQTPCLSLLGERTLMVTSVSTGMCQTPGVVTRRALVSLLQTLSASTP